MILKRKSGNHHSGFLKGHKKALAVLLALFVGSSGMYAYYTDQTKKDNQITIGQNDITIVEQFTPPDEIKPGVTFDKFPQVQNVKSVPCYVRMFADVGDSDVNEFLTINFESSKWTTKQDDGYYYYTEILEPGSTSEPLFTTVSISENADESKFKDFDILIYAESVQSEGYETYEDAWAEFTR